MGWPKFDDEQSLKSSLWAGYFESVYGSVPSGSGYYPICVFDFWFLYTDKFANAGITDHASVGTCPSQEGDHFAGGIGFQSQQASWIWHPGPFSGIQSSTWVEVTHRVNKLESEGAWFMQAPGSGLWVNLKNTKAYTEHSGVFEEFTNCEHTGEFNELCLCGKKHGIDSLQFLAHDDPEWKCKDNDPGPQGNWRQGSSPLDIEIVMCELDGRQACGGMDNAFRAGWMASQACDCDNSLNWPNCKWPEIAPR